MSARDDNYRVSSDPKDEKSGIDMQSLVADAPTQTLDIFEGSIDPIYEAKARILNEAIQEIGMGKYQVISVLDGLMSCPNRFFGLVVLICRGRLWLVFVSVSVLDVPFWRLCACRDNLWPVSMSRTPASKPIFNLRDFRL